MTDYCKPSDVRLLVSTTLEDPDISRLIEQSSAEIDRRIGAQSTSDQVVEKLCALITAYGIKIQKPQSESMGNYRADMGSTLEQWDKEIQRIYRLYTSSKVRASSYRHIDETKRYRVDIR